MSRRIDDNMLKRLVTYEEYVGKLFTRAAQRRWLEMNADVVQDYERLKVLKKQISSLVDLAFCRYGEARGLMKIDRANLPSDLDEDLDVLAMQLQQVEWDSFQLETAPRFARVN